MSAVIGNKAIRLPGSTGTIANSEREFGNVMLRWNTTDSRAEYSTDGTNWTAFGSGGGLFSLTDAAGTPVDADEIRYIDDTDDGVHALTMGNLKEFLARHVPGTPGTPGTDPVVTPGTPLTDSFVTTTGNSHTLTQAQLDDHDLVWFLGNRSTSGGVIPIVLPTSEMKRNDITSIRTAGSITASWTRLTRTLTITSGGFDFLFLTKLSTTSISETVLAPSTNTLTLTQTHLDDYDWIWLITVGNTPLIFPTAILKSRDLDNTAITPTAGNIRSGGGNNRLKWVRNTNTNGGTFTSVGNIIKALAFTGQVSGAIKPTEVNDANSSNFPIILSDAEYDDNDFIWFINNLHIAAGRFPIFLPMKVLKHADASSISDIRLAGNGHASWTQSSQTLSAGVMPGNFFESAYLSVGRIADTVVAGTPGTPDGPSGVSLQKTITDRATHALSSNSNAAADMIGKFVAVTASAANLVLTFPDNLGGDGQVARIGNAGTNAFSVRANDATETAVNRPVAAGATIEVEKNSGKWYF